MFEFSKAFKYIYFSLLIDWKIVVCRGFSGTYVKEYIEASNPAFAIGEYWDSLGYEHGNLCYNQGNNLQLGDEVCIIVLPEYMVGGESKLYFHL